MENKLTPQQVGTAANTGNEGEASQQQRPTAEVGGMIGETRTTFVTSADAGNGLAAQAILDGVSGEKTPGQCLYELYCEARGWAGVGFEWSRNTPELRDGWEKTAQRFMPPIRTAPAQWPDIGEDPLKKNFEDRRADAFADGAFVRLGQGVGRQQPHVPDQTMLAWRIDVDRVRCELVHKRAFFEYRQLPEHHEVHPTGAWKQSKIVGKPMTYDTKYVEDRYSHAPCEEMSAVRLKLLQDHIWPFPETSEPKRILDFGCGNGAFVKLGNAWAKSKNLGMRFYGHDITGMDLPDVPRPLPIPIGFRALYNEEFDVVTFFDSLEHVEDVEGTLRSLSGAKHIIISLPWCHAWTRGKDWFRQWKHYRLDEHLWYFDATSLCEMLWRVGYKPVFIGNPEDSVRKSADHLPNILTGVFEKVA